MTRSGAPTKRYRLPITWKSCDDEGRPTRAARPEFSRNISAIIEMAIFPLQDGLTALVQQTPCHQSYPCVASRKGNFADCDWFQCFLLCDAEKLGCPKMFSQGSAQRAAIRRRRAFRQITPSKRPFAFGCRRTASSNWLAPRGAQTEKTRTVDRRQRIPCRACKKYGRAAKAAEIRIVRQPRRSWEHDMASTAFNSTSGVGSSPSAETLVQNCCLRCEAF